MPDQFGNTAQVHTKLIAWREKRGEAEPPDYSDNLLIQLGVATEPLNRRWYEKTTGQAINDDGNYVCSSGAKSLQCATQGHFRKVQGDPSQG